MSIVSQISSIVGTMIFMANFKSASGKNIFYFGQGIFIIYELLRIVYVRDWNDNIYIND